MTTKRTLRMTIDVVVAPMSEKELRECAKRMEYGVEARKEFIHENKTLDMVEAYEIADLFDNLNNSDSLDGSELYVKLGNAKVVDYKWIDE